MTTTVQNQKVARTLHNRRAAGMILRYILAIIITIVMVFPLFWMLSTSLKTEQQVMSSRLVFWPTTPQWENFAYPFRKVPFLRYMLNTACVTASVFPRTASSSWC